MNKRQFKKEGKKHGAMSLFDMARESAARNRYDAYESKKTIYPGFPSWESFKTTKVVKRIKHQAWLSDMEDADRRMGRD